MEKKPSGWIALCLGIIGEVFSAVIISNDMTPRGMFGGHYTYEPPLTSHEIIMIVIAIASGIAIIAGICMLKQKKINY